MKLGHRFASPGDHTSLLQTHLSHSQTLARKHDCDGEAKGQGGSRFWTGIVFQGLVTFTLCLANGFQPQASSLWIQCDQRKGQQNVLGVKGLYPTLFPGGRSVTKIPFTQSESAYSKRVSASGPLCPHSRPTRPSSGPVLGAATTPASALLSCSLTALPPCRAQSTGWSSLYRVNSHVLATGVQ